MKKLLPTFFTIFTLLFFYSLTLTTSPVFAVVDPECKPDEVSPERDPRPASCNICNITDLLTPSCATSFKVFDEVKYLPTEGPIVKKDWEGEITVNPADIKIPFVGMRNMEEETWLEKAKFWDIPDENAKRWFQLWEISNANESKYLADYLEGTNEYYRNYGNQTTLTDYQGVLRKLTPFEYQNQLKKQLIARVNNGESNQIHDYKIKYIGRFCWDTPFWIDAGKFIFENLQNLIKNSPPVKGILTFFSHFFNINEEEFKIEPPDIGHYCLYASLQEGIAGWSIVKINELTADLPIIGPIYSELLKISQKIPGLVHFYLYPTVDKESLSSLTKENQPPDPNEEKYKKDPAKYEEDFLKWKYDENGNLSEWYRLWQATPMLSREDTLGEINPYLAKEHEEDSNLEFKSEEAKLESVPHLARLYEGSQIISNLLTPTGEKKIEMVKTEPTPETTPPNACFKENYILTNEGDSLCCEPIIATFKAVEEFPNPDYEECHQGLDALRAKCASLTLINSTVDERLECYQELYDLEIKCAEEVTKDVSRGFGINLKHPYLDEIWSYTTNANGGFFNIFRPHGVPAFEDIDAAQVVKYSYNPKGLDQSGVVSPEEGLFFFPHLGGVQKAKEWVVNQALWPYEEK